MCRTLGVLPSPLWGGVGGGGREMEAPALPNCATPLPSPPPQGGREQTEFAACADPTSPECALVRRWVWVSFYFRSHSRLRCLRLFLLRPRHSYARPSACAPVLGVAASMSSKPS